MKFYTTLKQKDLAAVSAQQLFDSYYGNGNGPKNIQRFDQYDIISDISHSDLFKTISETYIFANPNKHHLITNSTFFNSNMTYVNVSRKKQLNLNSKVVSLSKIFPKQSITAVYHSELWAFMTPENQSSSTLISELIESSRKNIAPFSHPVIHKCSVVQFSELVKQLEQPVSG